MKLKIQADDKDVFIFAIFCVALFYFVAIGYLNAENLVAGDGFHGLNPLPAFAAENFAAVMVFFILFLIVVIFSVNSYFFKMEKGVGINIGGKDEKGYTRFAKEKEIKKDLKLVYPTLKTSSYGGIPLINNGKEIWVDDDESHSLIIGATGSGKTQAIVHPTVKILAKRGESMIVTDPKGEIYEENAEMLREKGYNIVLLNFRNPQRGNCWNPMYLPYSLYREGNQDKANELLDDLALNILYDEATKGQDPFWEKTSADYFAGLSLGLFEDAKKEEINLNSIGLMTTAGEERALGSTYIKEYFNHKEPTSPAYVNAASTLMAASETKASIMAVFKQKIKLFTARENLSEMLASSDFDMKDIGRKKTAVFLLIHDEKKTYHFLLTVFIKQCYESLIDVAQESGGKLQYRTNFILDEFANMPPLKDVTTMVTAARSRNMRFNFFVQNFSQLSYVYGKEEGDTIRGNCSNLIYLISSELSALEEISKLCGEEKSKEKDKTDSRPLVTVSDLQRLKKFEALILKMRQLPFKTKLTPNFKMDWGDNYNKAEYITRPANPVKVFDIKRFVEEKRKTLFDDADKKMNKEIKPPIGGESVPPKGVDLDALIQRMDEKIAELEKEEEEAMKQNKVVETTEEKPPEKSKQTEIKHDRPFFNDKPNIKDSISFEDELEDIPVEKITPPSIEIEKSHPTDTTQKLEKNEENIQTEKKGFITDDQFFDDFFSDDE